MACIVLILDKLELGQSFTLIVALGAVDGASFLGLKGDRGFCTTVSTYSRIHLSGLPITASTLPSPSSSALWTAARFMLQSARQIELLLTGGKGTLLPTVTAHKCLIFQSHKLRLLYGLLFPCLTCSFLTPDPSLNYPIIRRIPYKNAGFKLRNNTEQRSLLIKLLYTLDIVK
jgi:hypothetical protein